MLLKLFQGESYMQETARILLNEGWAKVVVVIVALSVVSVIMLVAETLVYGRTSDRNSVLKKLLILCVPVTAFLVFSASSVVTMETGGSWIVFAGLTVAFYVATVISYIGIKFYTSHKSKTGIEQIRILAYYDNLTGLENRRAYKEYIDTLNDTIKNSKQKPLLSIIMLDVNGLKKTNDIYGHLAGDELIIGSSECIKNVFSSVGRCFRTGGDEFVVIAYMKHEQFIEKSEELEQTLSNWKGEYINGISISIGKADMAEYPDHDADQLMIEADKLMYKNKQNYYTSQIMADNPVIEGDAKSARKMRYADNFSLTKYTMPVIRQMAEVIPGGFFIYRENEQREIIYQNSKVLEIYGCSTVDEFQELTSNSFEKMVHPDDFATVQASIDHQIDSEEGDSMDHVIYRIIRKDGTVRWVDDYGHYSHSPDYGDIYYVFITDITQVMTQKGATN
jgi:diguanylate cyclase (GGDEF)-like protein/PAS domain S-box-containing protein